MAMDPRIREAIEIAVEEDGQDESLSRKLVAWFEALSSGNERINNGESRPDLIYKSTTLRSSSTPDGGGEQSDSGGSPDR